MFRQHFRLLTVICLAGLLLPVILSASLARSQGESPFAEPNNREHPCPPGGCDAVKGRVLIKLAAPVKARQPDQPGAMTEDTTLNETLAALGILTLEPVFPALSPLPLRPLSPLPSLGEGRGGWGVRGEGAPLPQPDLTRWYRATLADESTDLNTAIQALSEMASVEYAEPDYLRKLADQPSPLSPLPRGERGTLRNGSAFPLPLVNPEAGDEDQAPSMTPLSLLGRGAGGEGRDAGGEGRSLTTTTDPLYPQQWHLTAARIPEAWAYLQSQGLPPGGNRDIVVAVIDTGVDYNHPDLAASMWTNSREIPGNGIDDDHNGFVDDVHGADVIGPTGNPMDDHGHGTHVAGIIAAQANNNLGGTGVAPNVQIMAIKAAQYSGALASSDIAEAVYYAIAQGAEVINMSFGGYARSQIEEDALAVAFNQAVLVAAAGNDGKANQPCPFGRDMYPAAYNWVLGVMASTPQGYLTGFSNFDCIPHDAHEYEVMAPGVDVWSTLPHDQYAAWDGTSMAAPIVSGIAALARTKWSDKNLYSSRFIMGQIAANTSPPQAGGAGGVVDAYTTLTVPPQPELSYLEHWLFDTAAQSPSNDDDGIVDAGETVDLGIVIRNHWGKADPVTVTLEAQVEGASQPDPYVTLLIDTVDYGAVGSFNVDDNGLIYDAQGAVTGVRNPFRFTVDPNTPNDHIIPFRLTMTARNGLDPADTTVYSSHSRFSLVVQRGRELPRIISQDLVLTKDYFWLVPDQILIEAGAVVTVTAGTQVQFWSANPNDPYHPNPNAFIQVEGKLIAQGTVSEPVEMFPSDLQAERPVLLKNAGAGQIILNYTRIRNPQITRAKVISHAYFDQSSFWFAAAVKADAIDSTIFHKLSGLEVADRPQTSLFDSSTIFLTSLAAQGNVFLKNYKLSENQQGQRTYYVSSAANAGYSLYTPPFARSVFPTTPITQLTQTYFAVSSSTGFDLAELYAQQFGGHLVDIDDAAENAYLYNYRQQYFTQAKFDQTYPGMNCGGSGSNCWSQFSGDFTLGLTDRDQEGLFTWISGLPLTYTNWSKNEPNNGGPTGNEDYVAMSGWNAGTWYDQAAWSGPFILEVPGTWTQAQLDSTRNAFINRGPFNQFKYNAILNTWWDPNINHWLRFTAGEGRDTWHYLTDNFWGTTSPTLIEAAIWDYTDDFNRGRYIYQPILTTPSETTYPFVVDVVLSTAGSPRVSIVRAETVTFTVTFNRDMDTALEPTVSFGPNVPNTDYTIHRVGGGWQNARTWLGRFNVTPITGDGYQLVRIAGARAASDPWLVTGDDSERFRFEIVTSGTEAMNLQAAGGEGYTDLAWSQNDFDLLAGFNLYRATSQNGSYSRLNPVLIPSNQHIYRDTTVQPGQPYYYKFTVVKTDMSESAFSNVALATPVDTVPPVIQHTVIVEAPAGLPLTFTADVTDNVSVRGVTLYFRSIGSTPFTSRTLTLTSGNRYAVAIEGSRVVPPGLEYYLEATDGMSTVRYGRPDYPYQVKIVDRPVPTAVSPNHGPVAGGTVVTIAGSNFKEGATVTFGSAGCANVTFVSPSQVTCTTPPYFPETVDVTVINPGGQSGTLLRGFTYESDTATLSLPHTGSDERAIVQVPVNATNIRGLAGADLRVIFSTNVLRPRDATPGSLTSGWSLVPNTNSPGMIRLSLASPGGTVSGSGTLALLEFEVVGTSGMTTTLHFYSISLNDGAIPVQTTDGSFGVNLTYQVSGKVRFWKDNAAIPGTLLTLSGDRYYTGQSDASGAYTVTGAPSGAYVLVPSKSDGVNGISAYDASLVLQHAAGLITLGGNAAIAADVNKNGAITSMDAFYILQKSVDLVSLPFPGAGVVWDFIPPSRSYSGPGSIQQNQDFTTVLLGDVSGNWSAGAQMSGGAEVLSGAKEQEQGSRGALSLVAVVAEMTLDRLYAEPGERITATLAITLNQASVYGADLVITYDPGVIRPTSVNLGEAAGAFMMSSNLARPGVVRMSLAGSQPLGMNGRLLSLAFDVVGNLGTTSGLHVFTANLNEGVVQVQAQDGAIRVVNLPDYDFDRDCQITAADVMRVVSRWKTRQQLPGYISAYDLDHDGDIDIADLQRASSQWGEICH